MGEEKVEEAPTPPSSLLVGPPTGSSGGGGGISRVWVTWGREGGEPPGWATRGRSKKKEKNSTPVL